MDILQIILTGSIIFAFVLVGIVMAFVRMVKLDQRARQAKMVEQAKTIHAQQEIMRLKDQILDEYRNG